MVAVGERFADEDSVRLVKRRLLLRGAASNEREPVAGVLAEAKEAVRAAGLEPDYLSLVQARSLEPLDTLAHPARIITAARLGNVRLLDNVPV